MKPKLSWTELQIPKEERKTNWQASSYLYVLTVS